MNGNRWRDDAEAKKCFKCDTAFTLSKNIRYLLKDIFRTKYYDSEKETSLPSMRVYLLFFLHAEDYCSQRKTVTIVKTI